jgi:hypothetical protein
MARAADDDAVDRPPEVAVLARTAYLINFRAGSKDGEHPRLVSTKRRKVVFGHRGSRSASERRAIGDEGHPT